MFKKTLAIVLALAVLFTMSIFTGCTPQASTQTSASVSTADTQKPAEKPSESQAVVSPSAGEKKVVGFSMYYRRDEWWKDLEKTAVETAKKLNIELVLQDADTKSETQVQQLETFKSQKVDAIMFASVDGDSPLAIVKEAKDAGIPVFTIDTGITDSSNLVSAISHDHYKGAYDIGVLAAEFINKNFDGKGKVALISDPTNIVLKNRVKGFTDALKKECPGAVFLTEQNGQCNRDLAMTCTNDILTANPDVAVIYGGNPDMGYGAIAALESKGVDPSKVGVYCEGWGKETVQYMMKENSYLKAVMVTPSDTLAVLALQTIRDYLDGKQVAKQTLQPSDVVDKNNCAEYFARYGIKVE